MKAASAKSCSKRKSPFNGKPEFRLAIKASPFDEGFRADILLDRQVIIEIKAVANLLPVHDAQVLTYLRMSGLRLGLLFNFHARLLKDAYGRACPWRVPAIHVSSLPLAGGVWGGVSRPVIGGFALPDNSP